MSEQPKTQEPVPVQLTRIEGTLNLVAYQMSEVKTEVSEAKAETSRLGDRITAVELAQAQSAGSAQSWKTWLPILLTAIAVAIAYAGYAGG